MTVKIKQFDKQNLVELRAAMAVAFAKIEQDFGVKVEIGRITYGADNFKCGIQAILTQTVTDPYLTGVSAGLINDFTRYVFKNKLCTKVQTSPTSPTYVIVGKKGHNLITKLDGQPTGGMYRLEFRNGNYLYCQVLGQKYDPLFDGVHRRGLPDFGV